MAVAPDHVDVAFQCLLGRRPESDETMRAFVALGSLQDVIDTIACSPEARARAPVHDSPFWHYNSQIDALAIIKSHEASNRVAVPDRLVNFNGVVIDPAFYPPLLAGRGGSIEGLPIPANWHADIAEFAAALRAVDLAKDTFRVLELGCGWGCWLLITGVAARNRGLEVDLIGAEGDEGHVAFARRACAENGFSPADFHIHRGIVGPKEGIALFPKQDQAGGSWGLEPRFDASPDEVEAASRSGKYDALPILTLGSISKDQPIDLLHIDIQGGEADFIESCLDDLQRYVRYIVIGTHSREIEGRLMRLFDTKNWVLEIERPAIFGLDGERRVTACDGVQGWRNGSLSE